MKKDVRIGVIEGDIESVVDSEKIAAEGVPAVQLRTGGSCHLDAPMIRSGLDAGQTHLENRFCRRAKIITSSPGRREKNSACISVSTIPGSLSFLYMVRYFYQFGDYRSDENNACFSNLSGPHGR
jgi:hypothetical protein